MTELATLPLSSPNSAAQPMISHHNLMVIGHHAQLLAKLWQTFSVRRNMCYYGPMPFPGSTTINHVPCDVGRRVPLWVLFLCTHLSAVFMYIRHQPTKENQLTSTDPIWNCPYIAQIMSWAAHQKMTWVKDRAWYHPHVEQPKHLYYVGKLAHNWGISWSWCWWCIRWMDSIWGWCREVFLHVSLTLISREQMTLALARIHDTCGHCPRAAQHIFSWMCDSPSSNDFNQCWLHSLLNLLTDPLSQGSYNVLLVLTSPAQTPQHLYTVLQSHFLDTEVKTLVLCQKSGQVTSCKVSWRVDHLIVFTYCVFFLYHF